MALEASSQIGSNASMQHYSVSPNLLIYPRSVGGSRRFVAELSAAEPPLILHQPAVAVALSTLPAAFSLEAAVAAFEAAGIERVLSEELVGSLVDANVFILAPTMEAEGRQHGEWNAHGWAEAYSYHCATRDYPFVMMDNPQGFAEDDKRMRAFLEAESPPSIYQELRGLRSIQLKKLSADQDLVETIASMDEEARRGLDGVSILMDTCFGERGKKRFAHQGEFLHKSIPSGGARHPTEVFLLAFDGFCVPTGTYHYNVQRNSLELIIDGDSYTQAATATFDLFKKYPDRPIALLVFTSLVERAMWRYRDSRSWRAPLIDIGHALMAYRILAKALGFKHYTYQKFDDRAVCRLLNISPLSQLPLFVGTLVASK